MGILRLLLALAVVIDHTGTHLHGVALQGGVAVQAFFIISGFYIALILNRKYNFPGATRLFYQQRYLRLVPMYWLAVLGTLFASAAFSILGHAPAGKLGIWVDKGPGLSLVSWLVLAVSQASMLGLDGLMFCAIGDHGALHLTPSWTTEALPAVRFMLVPPAWSLSVELLFYLTAPFLVRRSVRFQAGIILTTFALRIGCALGLGLSTDPWGNRFFPFEAGLFLLGSLAFRSLPLAEQVIKRFRALRYVLTAALVGLALGYERLPGPVGFRHWGFLLLVLVSVPLLFTATQRDPIDRWIGEMSYPLYLLHQLSGFVAEPLMRRLSGVTAEIAALLVPLIVAAVVYWLIERRFENWRARRFERNAKPASDRRETREAVLQCS